ncbi:carbamoyl phosphate synthase small subunit [Pseudogracilibacillus auburnensis]|uniref:carbamoyl phosphate synthase small subunit n=1 Tax=Pseudogracilibacillus auburnensis TaxID=1494959 RepID=UPI001A965438|nr:carbamoyl phosphate synthase small subunit [Pseudogracilibacillus auburnensis]MBO1004959.1 carbamoyl phosphate synthase small subunit [Pseudogracilibacillus auburnensis]
MKRKLILEDGTVLIGDSFGWDSETTGEVVFNTSMTGYQEIISDPSNYGQIVIFSYPMIGNYGINRDDFESIQPVIKGVVVKEVCDFPSNWRNEMSLDEYLKHKRIPGISGIDTRMLTRLIRNKGTMKGAICSMEADIESVLARLEGTIDLNNPVEYLSTTKPYPSPGRGKNVVVIDFGLKHSILRELTERGCDVKVVPYNMPAEDILTLNPDGVLLSNGPGNPAELDQSIETIKAIQGKIPLLGIGLGHQLFALANGCSIKKMHVGHRGSSYPIKNLKTGQVIFTAQNHGYEVDEHTIDHSTLSITYRSLNGNSIEGLEHKKLSAFSLQYQPEASPGSEDGKKAFDEFMQLMTTKDGKVEHHAEKN